MTVDHLGLCVGCGNNPAWCRCEPVASTRPRDVDVVHHEPVDDGFDVEALERFVRDDPPSSNGDAPPPDEPLDGILDDLLGWLIEHVAYASPMHPVAVALWAAHTFALDRAASTPRLAFLSPEPESGKTRNLELLELVVRQGRLVLQMSPASLYRWVDRIRPTILLDEVDAVFGPKASKDHEDLRALVNAGHRPGATVPRCEPPSMRVVEFSAFAPVALAGIGKLPDTIRSRSIIIPMRRRAPDERIRPYRERITRPEGEVLRRRLAAWVDRHGHCIAEDPELPAGVTDRQADQWEPLVAIADAAGGDWPDLARRACVELATVGRGTDDASLGVRLLAAIRDVFGDRDRLDTASLIAGLCDIDDAPWGDWLDGKSDKSRGGWLAKRLKPYGISPAKHRYPDGVRQGYLADDFADVWQRYLPDKRNKGNKRNTPASDVPFVPSVPFSGQGDTADRLDLDAHEADRLDLDAHEADRLDLDAHEADR